jgi:hypothetical protein
MPDDPGLVYDPQSRSSAAWNAWVDARVAIAIAEHQSIIAGLARFTVEFANTTQKKFDAMEQKLAAMERELELLNTRSAETAPN